MADDDDDERWGGMYEDGHWFWDDSLQGLTFASNRQQESLKDVQLTIVTTGALDFKDDIDLIEQIRFRRRYQRKVKPGMPDIITLQDVKDIALFTAPSHILSVGLVNLLHMTTIEKFIRALILYCQYFLQITDEMDERNLEMDSTIRTPACDEIEATFTENLMDLRLLVAKEYFTFIAGGADTVKYHHMGPKKNKVSLSNKDAKQFESLLRMSIQIVWLALGRRSFSQIEIEVHRLFKTDKFNIIMHKAQEDTKSQKVSKREKSAMLIEGPCLKMETKLSTKSPLANSAFCGRDFDYRIFGVGSIEYERSKLPIRIIYMEAAVACDEAFLEKSDVVVGILGMARNLFDTMLHPLHLAKKSKSSNLSTQSSVAAETKMKSSMSTKSSVAMGSKGLAKREKRIYPKIILPAPELVHTYPPFFIDEPFKGLKISSTQRRRWLDRMKKVPTTRRSQKRN